MEHIKIEQNSNVEVVDSNIIHKLAEEAQDCDASSNMTGNLQTDKAFRSDVNFLTGKFPGLSINAQNYYIDFADDEVARVMNSNYGDGIGITEAEAAAITESSSNPFAIFQGNTEINTFEELKKFTSLNSLHFINKNGHRYGAFEGCTNLKKIDLKYVTQIDGFCFQDCRNLEELGDFHPTQIGLDGAYGERIFENCTKLKTVDLSLLERIVRYTFLNCKAFNIADISNIKHIDLLAFYGCENLSLNVNLPNYGTITSLYHGTYLQAGAFGKTAIKTVEDLGLCTHICGSVYMSPYWRPGAFADCSQLRYAILPSTLQFIGIAAFRNDIALEYIKISATTPPTLENTSPSSDDFPFDNTTCNFYVPDASVNDYKAASGWDGIASRIFPMSQFSTDFPNG